MRKNKCPTIDGQKERLSRGIKPPIYESIPCNLFILELDRPQKELDFN